MNRHPLSRLGNLLRKHGISGTLALTRKNLAHELRWYLDRRFDRLHGTDTSDRIELDGLDIEGDNRGQGVYYEPTSTELFRLMMSHVTSRLSCEDFTFIDFGSGKGRTLLLASDYPFQSIIGVEFARELHEIAQRNVSTYRGGTQRCADLKSVHSDASVFEPPPHNLLIYFYNPFLGDLMARVIENVAAVSRRAGTRVALVYFNPLSASAVEASGLFKRSEEVVLPRDYSRQHQRKCLVYLSWK